MRPNPSEALPSPLRLVSSGADPPWGHHSHSPKGVFLGASFSRWGWRCLLVHVYPASSPFLPLCFCFLCFTISALPDFRSSLFSFSLGSARPALSVFSASSRPPSSRPFSCSHCGFPCAVVLLNLQALLSVSLLSSSSLPLLSLSFWRSLSLQKPSCSASRESAMVWVEDWSSFSLAARDIFLHSPTAARFALKCRRSDSLLSIKVTDNVSCVKYRATSPSEVPQIERLASAFLSWACCPDLQKGGPAFSVEGLLGGTWLSPGPKQTPIAPL